MGVKILEIVKTEQTATWAFMLRTGCIVRGSVF